MITCRNFLFAFCIAGVLFDSCQATRVAPARMMASPQSPAVEKAPNIQIHAQLFLVNDSMTMIPGVAMEFRCKLPDSTIQTWRDTSRSNGSFQVSLPSGCSCQVKLSKEAQEFASSFTTASDSTDRVASGQNFYIHYIEMEEELPFFSVGFDLNQATIKSESLPRINNFVSLFLKSSNHPAVVVEGHTDPLEAPRGQLKGEQYQYKLGLARAKAVCAYLVNKGIERNTLFVTSYGGQRPVAPSTSPEYRRVNRRAELKGMPLNEIRGRQYHTIPYLKTLAR